MGIFDPQPTTGTSFLDRLLAANANAAIANQPIGAPGDQADYSTLAMQPIDPATGNTIQSAPMPPVQPMATAPTSQVQPTPASPLATPGIQAAAGEFGNHLMTAYQNMHNGGGLIGSVVSAITGQRNDPQAQALALQQHQQQQLYTAMVNAGIPQQTAALASQNTEAAKVILAQKFPADQKDKFSVVKTGQDAMGRETYSSLNQSTGEMTPIKGSSDTGDLGAGIPGDTTKSGQEYIASLPQEFQAPVAGLVSGTYKLPSFRSAKSAAYTNTLFAMAKQADPTFDSTSYGARQAGMKSFMSGADAGTVRSANQVLGHISDLTDKADALGNSSFTPYNWAKNEAGSLTGSDAPGNWITQAHAVADEMSSFMKGAGRSSDTEIQQWKDSLSPNMSPQQQRGAVNTLLGIYDHSLQALEDKRTGAIGPMASQKLGPLLTPAGQGAMNKIRQWASGGSTPAAQGTTSSGVKWSVQ